MRLDLMAVLHAGQRTEQQTRLLPDLQRSVQAQDEASPWRKRLRTLSVVP